MDTTTIIVLIIIFGLIANFYYRIRQKNREHKARLKEKEDQEKAKHDQVVGIIKHSCGSMLEDKSTQHINAFTKWQEKHKKLLEKASMLQKAEIAENLKVNQYLDYTGKNSTKHPGKGYRLILENCFTEPYSSSYFSVYLVPVQRLLSELVILKAFHPVKSKDCYAYVKFNFESNKKGKRVSVIDIYCKI